VDDMLRYVHDNEVANIQEGIRLGHLARGVIVTRETDAGKFEMNVFVVPAVPADQITVQLDPSKFNDGRRRDFGV
jgi:hypothetical protein